MKPIILYEIHKYTLTELQARFSRDDVGCAGFIRLCEERKILDRGKGRLSFKYVGVLVYDSRLILFMPKYLPANGDPTDSFRKMRQLIHLLKVIALNSVEMDDLEISGDFSQDEPFRLLSIIDFLLQDYIEYGLYRREKKEYVLSGHGEIDWQRTIDSRQAYLLNPYTPVYLDVITEEAADDREHILVALHKQVLNHCSRLLKETGLNEFFPYPDVEFHDADYVPDDEEVRLGLIRSAMNEEYSDRKIRLLKALHVFISRESFSSSDHTLLFFGTRSFHTVWEKCCKYVMDHNASIVGTISRPIWVANGIRDTKKDTLIPDIVRTLATGETKMVLIADAKYYSIVFNKSGVCGQPGVEDILKQQIYEQALRPYMKQQGYEQARNVFLFPASRADICKFGKVLLDFLPMLEPVQLFYMPAENIYESYIRQQRWTSADWRQFMEQMDGDTAEMEELK